jgi:hypothetical protein
MGEVNEEGLALLLPMLFDGDEDKVAIGSLMYNRCPILLRCSSGRSNGRATSFILEVSLFVHWSICVLHGSVRYKHKHLDERHQPFDASLI